MKKLVISVVSMLIVAFVIITVSNSKKNGNQGIVDVKNTIDSLQRKELNDFWNLYRQATSLRIDGKWEEAIEYYQRALQINNEHEDAIYYLGNMFLESGNDSEAEKAWLQLLEKNPQSSRAHYQLGNLYMNSSNNDLYDLRRAAIEFERTIAINKDFMQPLIQLGQISLYNADLSASYQYFSTVLGSDKKNIPSNYLIGYIKWKQGDLAKAQEYFNLAYKFSIPEESNTEVSNEGDTKGGKSLERGINQSIFHSYFIDLSGLSESNLSTEMIASYRKLDSFLTK